MVPEARNFRNPYGFETSGQEVAEQAYWESTLSYVFCLRI
jgi:hypothetical protein